PNIVRACTRRRCTSLGEIPCLRSCGQQCRSASFHLDLRIPRAIIQSKSVNRGVCAWFGYCHFLLAAYLSGSTCRNDCWCIRPRPTPRGAGVDPPVLVPERILERGIPVCNLPSSGKSNASKHSVMTSGCARIIRELISRQVRQLKALNHRN